MEKRLYFGVKSINGFFDVKEIRLPEGCHVYLSLILFLKMFQHDDFSGSYA